LRRIRGSSKYLRYQRIRIKCDWRNQLLQLIRTERLFRGLLAIVGSRRRSLLRAGHRLGKSLTLAHWNNQHKRAQRNCQSLPGHLSKQLAHRSGALPGLKNLMQNFT
jgi:hypothetical protein